MAHVDAGMAAQTWMKVERELHAEAPHLLARLPQGASEALLDTANATFGVALPELVRELYRIHNGIGMPAYIQRDDYRYASVSYFLSIEDSIEIWNSWKELTQTKHYSDHQVTRVTGAVRADWWNLRWIPIASDNAGSAHCVDLDPAPGGRVGQVVSVWHDHDERSVVGDDLATFLLETVDVGEWAATNER